MLGKSRRGSIGWLTLFTVDGIGTGADTVVDAGSDVRADAGAAAIPLVIVEGGAGPYAKPRKSGGAGRCCGTGGVCTLNGLGSDCF